MLVFSHCEVFTQCIFLTCLSVWPSVLISNTQSCWLQYIMVGSYLPPLRGWEVDEVSQVVQYPLFVSLTEVAVHNLYREQTQSDHVWKLPTVEGIIILCILSVKDPTEMECPTWNASCLRVFRQNSLGVCTKYIMGRIERWDHCIERRFLCQTGGPVL